MNLDTILLGIQKRAADASPLGNTLKLDFGENQVYIDGTGDGNVVSTENKDADCTVSVSMEDFLALTTGELNPMMAMMNGKIKLSGDMGVAMKLQSLLG